MKDNVVTGKAMGQQPGASSAVSGFAEVGHGAGSIPACPSPDGESVVNSASPCESGAACSGDSPSASVVGESAGVSPALALLSKYEYETREAWLQAAVGLMKPLFQRVNAPVPPLRISTGWPSTRALGKRRAIGQCWAAEAATDGLPQIFISPFLVDVLGYEGVFSTVAHELVHAVAGHEAKHGPEFKKIALAVGLEGKMTSCGFGPGMDETMKAWAEKLGPYPHAKLDSLKSPVKKQGTRMIKCTCPNEECGFTVRTTKKWLTDVGAPHCPKHGAMGFEAPEIEGEEPEADTE